MKELIQRSGIKKLKKERFIKQLLRVKLNGIKSKPSESGFILL